MKRQRRRLLKLAKGRRRRLRFIRLTEEQLRENPLYEISRWFDEQWSEMAKSAATRAQAVYNDVMNEHDRVSKT